MFQSLNSLGGSSLSSIASFHLTLTDVNDNPPRLVKEYTGLLFCYPLREAGSLIFEATDDDQQSLQGPHFTFSLGSKSLQNDWEVSKINGELSKVHQEKLMDGEISCYLFLSGQFYLAYFFWVLSMLLYVSILHFFLLCSSISLYS